MPTQCCNVSSLFFSIFSSSKTATIIHFFNWKNNKSNVCLLMVPTSSTQTVWLFFQVCVSIHKLSIFVFLPFFLLRLPGVDRICHFPLKKAPTVFFCFSANMYYLTVQLNKSGVPCVWKLSVDTMWVIERKSSTFLGRRYVAFALSNKNGWFSFLLHSEQR